MFDIRRATTAADWRDAAALIHDHVEWMRGWAAIDPLAEQPALAAELDALADHYGAGTRGAMFVARWSRTAVGCVAVRIHDDGTAELKRMYVRPVARGRGVADRLHATDMLGRNGLTRPAVAPCGYSDATHLFAASRAARTSLAGSILLNRCTPFGASGCPFSAAAIAHVNASM